MFIGHFGLGFAAKCAAPTVSLGTLFLACQFADLLWPTLLLAGVEVVTIDPGNTVLTPLNFVSYPYSHSLIMMAVWALAFAVCYQVLRPAPSRATVTLALLVLSHWVLDWLTHRPDMPLTVAGQPRLGLALWNVPSLAISFEFGLTAVGVGLYGQSTAARDRIGRMALWALVAFMVVVHIANLVGPPPPSVAAVAWSGQATWLLVAWGYWVDRHRRPAWRRVAAPARPA